MTALVREFRGHLDDAWHAAVFPWVALVAAGTGLLGSWAIDVATAVLL